MPRLAEAELAVQPVGVPGEQRPKAKTLQFGMTGYRGHQRLRDAPAAMALEDEDVGDVGVGGPVGDDAREADLARSLERTKADGMLDGTLHHRAGNPGRRGAP